MRQPTGWPRQACYYGGIDFGWRNPFAALWGYHEPESDVLYLTNERYADYETICL